MMFFFPDRRWWKIPPNVDSKNPDPSRSNRIDGRNIPSPGHRIGSGKSRILRTYLDP